MEYALHVVSAYYLCLQLSFLTKNRKNLSELASSHKAKAALGVSNSISGGNPFSSFFKKLNNTRSGHSE